MSVRIVVAKRDRTLILYNSQGEERRFGVNLGSNPDADKTFEGDGATPLGDFYVCAKNPRSRYFLSVCISYPNLAHAARGVDAGLITRAEHAAILDALRAGKMPLQDTRLGGAIYIHGRGDRPSGHEELNWTRGCIALANADMQEVYDRVSLGTEVIIRE